MKLHTERLKELLTIQKISYQQLADMTHISKATLHRYCQGLTDKIPVDRIWPIAYALNTTPQYLMGETDDPSPGYIGHTVKRQQSEDDTWTMLRRRSEESSSYMELLNSILKLQEKNISPVIVFIRMLQNRE